MLFSHSGVGDLKGTAVCSVESLAFDCIGTNWYPVHVYVTIHDKTYHSIAQKNRFELRRPLPSMQIGTMRVISVY